MSAYIKSRLFRQSTLAFIGLPLLIWAAGNFPERSLLKESLSIITILGFCQMMGQFFWARMRKESRCSHFRLDYPKMDTKNWNAWINIYKGSDGSMKLEKQPFGSWPT